MRAKVIWFIAGVFAVLVLFNYIMPHWQTHIGK
jgi:hypothetical protein